MEQHEFSIIFYDKNTPELICELLKMKYVPLFSVRNFDSPYLLIHENNRTVKGEYITDEFNTLNCSENEKLFIALAAAINSQNTDYNKWYINIETNEWYQSDNENANVSLSNHLNDKSIIYSFKHIYRPATKEEIINKFK